MNELGIVVQLDRKDGFGKYELSKNAENYGNPHLICMKCGNVIGIREDILDADLSAQILAKYHFEVKDARVKLYGVCQDCSKI